MNSYVSLTKILKQWCRGGTLSIYLSSKNAGESQTDFVYTAFYVTIGEQNFIGAEVFEIFSSTSFSENFHLGL